MILIRLIFMYLYHVYTAYVYHQWNLLHVSVSLSRTYGHALQQPSVPLRCVRSFVQNQILPTETRPKHPPESALISVQRLRETLQYQLRAQKTRAHARKRPENDASFRQRSSPPKFPGGCFRPGGTCSSDRHYYSSAHGREF